TTLRFFGFLGPDFEIPKYHPPCRSALAGSEKRTRSVCGQADWVFFLSFLSRKAAVFPEMMNLRLSCSSFYRSCSDQIILLPLPRRSGFRPSLVGNLCLLDVFPA